MLCVQRATRGRLAAFLVLMVVLSAGCGMPAIAAQAVAAPVKAGGEKADNGENSHLWRPRVRSVSVFKNGLGFFMREGDVRLREGWCSSKQIPPAIFGTLAIFAHNEGQSVDIVGSGPGEIVEFDGYDVAKTDQAKRRRLQACLGLNIELFYKKNAGDETDLSAAGKLVSIGPKFVILQAKTNNFAVPLGQITRMKTLELPIRVHVLADGEEQKKPKPAQRAKLGMAYLRKGVTWIPEYTLEIEDENTAVLTLRGTFINQAEDLVHCDINFVVGVPHFVHTSYMAPLAVGQVIRQISAAVAPKAIRTQIMNRAALVTTSQTMRGFDVVSRPVPKQDNNVAKAAGKLPQLPAGASTDYTVYTKKDMTVRRGEKAIVTLFTCKIKYSHVYRWLPPAAMSHLLVLQNTTPTAWTTGPCLVVTEDRPLSEDLLKYTPLGGSGEMPVTTAINVAHERTEKEVTRKLKAYDAGYRHYHDLVTLQGTLKVKNFEKRPVRIIIRSTVTGKLTEASDDGAWSQSTAELRLLKRQGTVSWAITLEPDKTKTLTYTYQRYVPSR